jgi:DNA sulfur modification protein DndD
MDLEPICRYKNWSQTTERQGTAGKYQKGNSPEPQPTEYSTMIFERLIFSDILSFSGRNEIVLPPVAQQTSLTVILAPNSAGKTNILRALEFLLYNKLPQFDRADAHKVINDHRRNLTEPGKKCEGYIEARMLVGDKSHTFRRRIIAQRSNEDCWSNEVKLDWIRHERDGDKEVTRNDATVQAQAEDYIGHLVEKVLFEYFYFEGEAYAKKLAQRGNNADLSKALKSQLHSERWREAQRDVKKIADEFRDDIKTLTAKDKAYQDATAHEQRIAGNVEHLKEQLKKSQDARDNAKDNYSDLQRRLITIASGTDHRDVAQQLEKASDALTNEKTKHVRTESDILQLIGASRGLPFLRSAIPYATEVLAEMRRENLLPADLSEPFLKRLLDSELCICGRELSSKSSSEARKCIELFKSRSMARATNEALMKLLNAIDGPLMTDSNACSSQLSRLLSVREEAIETQRHLEAEIAPLREKLAKSNHEEIEKIQKDQNYFSAETKKEKDRCDELEELLKRQQFILKQAKEERQRVEKGTDRREVKTLTAARDRADELHELIEQSLTALEHSLQENLQATVSHLYDSAANDGTHAWVSRSLLPEIRKGEDVQLNVGGGLQQLLALSHIIGLTELRKRLWQDLKDIGVLTPRADDQSFFLDSVFAPTDFGNARMIAEFLPNKARQMVVLLAPQQWHPNIREPLENAANKVYRLHRYTYRAPKEASDYLVTCKGKQIELVSVDQQEGTAFTKIEEVL